VGSNVKHPLQITRNHKVTFGHWVFQNLIVAGLMCVLLEHQWCGHCNLLSSESSFGLIGECSNVWPQVMCEDYILFVLQFHSKQGLWYVQTCKVSSIMSIPCVIWMTSTNCYGCY
jgi:hypothetical protein